MLPASLLYDRVQSPTKHFRAWPLLFNENSGFKRSACDRFVASVIVVVVTSRKLCPQRCGLRSLLLIPLAVVVLSVMAE